MILQTSENSSSRGTTQSALSNVPGKLAGPLRRLGSVFTRFMNHWRARAVASRTHAQENLLLELNELARPPDSSTAHGDLSVPEPSLAEQALRQIYSGT